MRSTPRSQSGGEGILVNFRTLSMMQRRECLPLLHTTSPSAAELLNFIRPLWKTGEENGTVR